MGNYCCPEEEQTPRRGQSIKPINTTHNSSRKPSSSNTRLQLQKQLTNDYPLLIRHIKQYGKQSPPPHYKKFYWHHPLHSDQLSQSYIGELIDQHDSELECIVKIIDKRKVQSIGEKRRIALEYLMGHYLQYHFLLNCIYAYENQDNMFLFYEWRGYEQLKIFAPTIGQSDFIAYFRKNHEQYIKFIAAGIILGLEKIHEMDIVYRAINFDNIAITQNGYPVLTNMSRVHPQGTGDAVPAANPFSSPEEFRGEPVTAATDFWALGVLIYYMLKGYFINYTTFKERQFRAEGVSSKLVDFVNQLLLVRPQRRLGCNGVMSLKYHNFFDDFDWKSYEQMQLESPLAEAMSTLPHPNKKLSKQYRETNSVAPFYNNYCDSTSLGSMLFMDIATIYILNSMFQGQYEPQSVSEPAAVEQDAGYNIEENQLATEIDLGGDFGFGDD